MTNAKLASGTPAAPKVYEAVNFDGGTATRGVLHFDYAAHDIIVRNSVITKGPQNGISVNQSGSVRIANVLFENCHILSQPRMGAEITNRASVCYQGIDFVGCTFDPQGNEAVSYDSNPWGVNANCRFTDNLVKGHGNVAAQPYAAGLEINGPTGVTATGNTFLRGRGPSLNLQMHTTGDCGWNVSDNVMDMTHKDAAQSIDMKAASQVVTALNVYGGHFNRNTVVSVSPGGSVAWWSGCHNMDWTGTTWRDASGRSGYDVPTRVNCVGNLL